MIINSILEFEVHNFLISLDEIVYDKKIDFAQYEKTRRLIDLGMGQITEGRENWDWKFLAKSGFLCEHDFEPHMFKEDLDKEGITKEDYVENWDKDDFLKHGEM